MEVALASRRRRGAASPGIPNRARDRHGWRRRKSPSGRLTAVRSRAREHETEALAALLERARRVEGGALVVRGGAGVGKTALLDWAVEQAHGFHALEASGAEFEMELAFAGLHVLCGPLLGGRDRLPPPPREALHAA